MTLFRGLMSGTTSWSADWRNFLRRAPPDPQTYMSRNQEALRDEVKQVCDQFPVVVQRIEDSHSGIGRLSSSIEDIKSEIASLIDQRQQAPKRERWHYRDL